MRSWISSIILAAFLVNTFLPPSYAQVLMPPPVGLVALSPAFHPPILAGVKVYAKDPFRFDFILNKGDAASLTSDAREVSSRLVKYFLAALTVPAGEMWVNLSPYEKDRIVPEAFGQTEMGRDLLAQDYLLKQLTSSLMYPEQSLGKKFWAEIYKQAREKFGTTDIPVDTFNKVWIVPAKAVVYEKPKVAGNKSSDEAVAYVVEARLKVMLESDYVAMSHQKDMAEPPAPAGDLAEDHAQIEPSPLWGGNGRGSDLAKCIIRQIIIPVLEKEINEGKNFARLRQVYNSLILATWYKKKVMGALNNSPLGFYVGQNKVQGVTIDDPKEAEKIWGRYVEAFQKGAYNFIREEYDPATQETVPRKYFAGGVQIVPDLAMTDHIDAAALTPENSFLVEVHGDGIMPDGDGAQALAWKNFEAKVNSFSHETSDALLKYLLKNAAGYINKEFDRDVLFLFSRGQKPHYWEYPVFDKISSILNEEQKDEFARYLMRTDVDITARICILAKFKTVYCIHASLEEIRNFKDKDEVRHPNSVFLRIFAGRPVEDKHDLEKIRDALPPDEVVHMREVLRQRPFNAIPLAYAGVFFPELQDTAIDPVDTGLTGELLSAPTQFRFKIWDIDRKEDVEDIGRQMHNILLKSFSTEETPSLDAIYAVLNNEGHRVLFVEDGEGHVAGFALILDMNDGSVTLGVLAIDPRYRADPVKGRGSMGLGSRILERVIRDVKTLGYSRIYFQPSDKNNAIGFYRKYIGSSGRKDISLVRTNKYTKDDYAIEWAVPEDVIKERIGYLLADLRPGNTLTTADIARIVNVDSVSRVVEMLKRYYRPDIEKGRICVAPWEEFERRVNAFTYREGDSLLRYLMEDARGYIEDKFRSRQGLFTQDQIPGYWDFTVLDKISSVLNDGQKDQLALYLIKHLDNEPALAYFLTRFNTSYAVHVVLEKIRKAPTDKEAFSRAAFFMNTLAARPARYRSDFERVKASLAPDQLAELQGLMRQRSLLNVPLGYVGVFFPSLSDPELDPDHRFHSRIFDLDNDKDANSVLDQVYRILTVNFYGLELLSKIEVEALLGDPSCRWLLLQDAEGKIAGFAMVRTLEGDSVGLSLVAVDPRYKADPLKGKASAGLGSIMLSRVIHDVRSLGYSGLYYFPSDLNNAQKFYERFVSSERGVSIARSGKHRGFPYVMQWDLSDQTATTTGEAGDHAEGLKEGRADRGSLLDRPVKALVFDLADTLYASDSVKRLKVEAMVRFCLENDKGLVEKDVRAKYIELDSLSGVVKYFGLDMKAFNKAIDDLDITDAGLIPNDELAALLQRLHRSYHLVLASNASDAHVKQVLQKLGLDQVFDRIYTQGSMGVGKPDPKFFSNIAESLGFRPGAVVSIGGSLEKEVNAATSAGLKAIHVQGVEDLMANVVARIEEINAGMKEADPAAVAMAPAERTPYLEEESLDRSFELLDHFYDHQLTKMIVNSIFSTFIPGKKWGRPAPVKILFVGVGRGLEAIEAKRRYGRFVEVYAINKEDGLFYDKQSYLGAHGAGDPVHRGSAEAAFDHVRKNLRITDLDERLPSFETKFDLVVLCFATIPYVKNKVGVLNDMLEQYCKKNGHLLSFLSALIQLRSYFLEDHFSLHELMTERVPQFEGNINDLVEFFSEFKQKRKNVDVGFSFHEASLGWINIQKRGQYLIPLKFIGSRRDVQNEFPMQYSFYSREAAVSESTDGTVDGAETTQATNSRMPGGMGRMLNASETPYKDEKYISRTYRELDNVYGGQLTKLIGAKIFSNFLRARRFDGPPVKVLFVGVGRGLEAVEAQRKFGKFVDVHAINKEPGLFLDEAHFMASFGSFGNAGEERARDAFVHVRKNLKLADLDQELPSLDRKFDLVVMGTSVMPYFQDKVGVLNRILTGYCNDNGYLLSMLTNEIWLDQYASGHQTDPLLWKVAAIKNMKKVGEYFKSLARQNKNVQVSLYPLGEMKIAWVRIKKDRKYLIPLKLQEYGQPDVPDSIVADGQKGLAYFYSVYVPDSMGGNSLDHPLNRAAVDGGIDLNPVDRVMAVGAMDGGGFFHFDPAALEKYRDAAGIAPVIIAVRPLNDLAGFLGAH